MEEEPLNAESGRLNFLFLEPPLASWQPASTWCSIKLPLHRILQVPLSVLPAPHH